MPTTIAVSSETRDRLMRLKMQEQTKSIDELLQRLLTTYRKSRLDQVRSQVQERADALGLTIEDLVD